MIELDTKSFHSVVCKIPSIHSTRDEMVSETPNILMIMVDSLRPDRLGCGGNGSAMTPNLDHLASSGAFLGNCFCPMPSSTPSRASIFTGRFPHSHGVRVNDIPLPSKEVTLVQILSEAGYQTAATPKLYLGFEKGFSQVESIETYLSLDLEPQGMDRKGQSDNTRDKDSEEVLRYHTTLITDSAIKWLECQEDKPWFFWVDYESTHEPWRPPEPYGSMFDKDYDGPDVSGPRMYEPDMGRREREHMMALYDGEVALVDKNIGRIIQVLHKLDLRSDTLIILLADHGVFLGEHDFFKKPPFLYDPLIRSTLIFSWAKGILPGTRVGSLSHLCDVMPTVLDLIEQPIPDACQGNSLASILQGQERKIPDVVFTEFCEYKGTAVKAVRTQAWKYIYYRSVGDIPWSGDYAPGEVFGKAGLEKEMLFDLSKDPSESTNVARSHRDVTANLRSLLIDWMVDTE